MTVLEPIDFAQLYRDQVQRNHLLPKPASAWDRRARDYARNSKHSQYGDDFLQRMDLSGARSALDVGCVVQAPWRCRWCAGWRAWSHWITAKACCSNCKTRPRWAV